MVASTLIPGHIGNPKHTTRLAALHCRAKGGRPEIDMRCIAVVEDNPDNRLLLQAMLEETFEVVEFASGPEALEGLPRSGAHLVLLDISLPGMDGVEVLRHIRESESADLPVIALTAHAMSGDRERFLAEGFDEYVSKPILDEDLLVSTILELIEKAEA